MFYKAKVSGDIATLAIWQYWDIVTSAWVDATVLPSTDDDVYSNNKVVSITSSFAVQSFNRSSVAAPYSIAQGGQFQIDGANDIDIIGDVNGTNVNQSANQSLSACMVRLSSHTGTCSLTGNQTGGSNIYAYGFYNTGSSTFTSIVGNQTGGSGTNAYGFYNTGSSTFTSIVGNQTGGSGTNAYGFYNTGSSTFTSIVGNQTGGSGTNAYGFYNTGSSTFTSIVGNQNGGSGGGSYGFRNAGSSTFTSIVGNQTGGSGTNADGFYNTGSSTFTSIVGNQTGGSSTSAYGFYNTGSSTFTSIVGNQNGGSSTNAYGFYNAANDATMQINFVDSEAYGTTIPAIYNSAQLTIIKFSGKTYNNLQTGVMAIMSLGNVNFDLSVFYIGLTPTYTDIALYPASVLENPPAITDVRTGVVYGIADDYTGTCAVPPKASVALNVPTDDTVGELITATTPADFMAALEASDLGLRLAECSTVDITGAQIAAHINT